MLDKFLEIASTPDWITPLAGMIQDRVNGPAHMFLIPDDCGWSGFEIRRLLKRHGVKTWGLMVVDNLILVSVRLAQAHYAQYILLREQIPIEYGLLDERARPATAARRNHSPTTRNARKSGHSKGVLAELSQAVDGLMDEVEALFGLRS
jgi:hypothetical protein